jgi:hypothetical protein
MPPIKLLCEGANICPRSDEESMTDIWGRLRWFGTEF